MKECRLIQIRKKTQYNSQRMSGVFPTSEFWTRVYHKPVELSKRIPIPSGLCKKWVLLDLTGENSQYETLKLA